MRNKICNIFGVLLENHRRGIMDKIIKNYCSKHNIKNVLSHDESKIIRQHLSPDYRLYLNFYKVMTGIFSKEFIPCWQYARIEMSMNPRRYSGFMQHKCNLHYFVPKENRPQTLVYAVENTIFDSNCKSISKEDAVNILKNESEFIFKKASMTGGGKDVVKMLNIDDGAVSRLIQSANYDFIAQKIVRQHPFLESLGFGSVNTIRVLSLNINNKTTILSCFLKMGGKGTITDNVSNGGYCCGVKNNGELNSFGYNADLEKITKSPCGIELSGKKIPHFQNVVEFVKENHENFKYAHLIGWDITIDSDGIPIVIEVNLDSAFIPVHQICNGPVFGNRYNEVMKWLKEHRPYYYIQVYGHDN